MKIFLCYITGWLVDNISSSVCSETFHEWLLTRINFGLIKFPYWLPQTSWWIQQKSSHYQVCWSPFPKPPLDDPHDWESRQLPGALRHQILAWSWRILAMPTRLLESRFWWRLDLPERPQWRSPLWWSMSPGSWRMASLGKSSRNMILDGLGEFWSWGKTRDGFRTLLRIHHTWNMTVFPRFPPIPFSVRHTLQSRTGLS